MKFEIGVRVGKRWFYTEAEDGCAALECMREINNELAGKAIDMDKLIVSIGRMIQGELLGQETALWQIHCIDSDDAPEA